MSEKERFELLKASFQEQFNGSDNEMGKEIADLVEVLRCQSLELEKVIRSSHKEALASGHWLDPIELSQPMYRLRQLYEQITGFGVHEFWDKVKEKEE